MKELNVSLEHCYGIKRLEHEFKFKNRTFAIYAPNGVMKTSFARTFDDYSDQKESCDQAFPERITKREIQADGNEIHPQDVLVIESYNEDYKSEKISTLLANKRLKDEYDRIHKEIDKVKSELVKKLKQLSGLTGRADDIEGTLEQTFGAPFFDLLLSLEGEINDSEPLPSKSLKYGLIFNEKVLNFLDTPEFKESLSEYIEKYNELIEQSPYLGKQFKFYHAENIQKQLVSNNFFRMGHTVNLYDGSNKNEFSSDEELSELLNNEKHKILGNEELKQRFDKIDKKLTNKDLRDFRDHLLDNKEVLPSLENMEELSKQIWMSYLVDQKDLSVELAQKYKDGQEEIKQLLRKASDERTEWEKVIRIFNSRFTHLPFYLRIQNKEDVILKGEVETIEFVFDDGEQSKSFKQKDELLGILSTGEKRALYILNIIFEVEARARIDEGGQDATLIVIDDIADSFDYKNKHAIVDYLKRMSEIEKFRMFILTHNFDFLRTIESRMIAPAHQCLMATKSDDGIQLEVFRQSYIRNPFGKWKSQLDNEVRLVASIPFVRNIVEYTQGTDENDDYLLLTSVLHFKDNTSDLTIGDVKEVFERNIQDIQFPELDLDQPVLEFIYAAADSCLEAEEGINLENKIVLSVAIRLRAEKFMIETITDVGELGHNQTWELLNRYQQEFNNEENNIEVLRRVNLITPANIHINSFMYEPILDMGDSELRQLYRSVCDDLT